MESMQDIFCLQNNQAIKWCRKPKPGSDTMPKRVTLKFKHQKFQEDAARSVVDCFAGQPNQRLSQYTFDSGRTVDQGSLYERIGYKNSPIRISKEKVFENIRQVQKMNGLKISPILEGQYNLTVEMETGTGKTYTYIKTMYELNRAYGWNKFIVVIPSIAIREGVFKAFQITQDHFLEDYGKKIRYFIYNSRQLTKLDAFATDSGINCMIINSQAFNARGKDARRIYMELDEFQSRKPIDVLAQIQPIMIIDEPQSVEGPQTQKSLKSFQPLFTLRYSATHPKKYNMIYQLDALDAYNQKLVKKISVKGIDVKGSTGSSGYLYFEGVELRGRQKPVARLEYEHKTNAGIRKRVRLVNEGDHLYEHSGGLEEYRGVSVLTIDGARNLIEFSNGTILHPGETVGDVSEMHLRRIQIREAIRSHIEKEMMLFHKNIKVLSLFFIDEVTKYKQYDEDNQAVNGIYADIFEQEYLEIVSNLEGQVPEDYWEYVHCDAGTLHNGYFSIDKNRRLVDTQVKNKGGKNEFVDDVDAYDLIMKDKERLLSFDEPTRFIFSHSALKEGWDNPNVFQICTLKHSDSAIRKQQEVGRGLRLCVNSDGDRMDANVPGIDVHTINTLTVIASESYHDFASTLQKEIAQSLSSRPKKASVAFFQDRKLVDDQGNTLTIDYAMATLVHNALVKEGYIDLKDELTGKYFDDLESEKVQLPPQLTGFEASAIELLNHIYSENDSRFVEDERAKNIKDIRPNDNFYHKKFQDLWKRINRKTIYRVVFDSDELVQKAVDEINLKLFVSDIYFSVTSGELNPQATQEDYERQTAFQVRESQTGFIKGTEKIHLKYDLVGQIVDGTRLTRKTVIRILQSIQSEKFNLFTKNPEEFLIKIVRLINEQKATLLIQQITYNLLDDSFDQTVFTENTLRGTLGVNAIPVKRHIFDYLVSDSNIERDFASELDISTKVEVYAKLPRGFYIPTPMGNYNPDWAICFKDDEDIKHIYFIAETKGTMSSLQTKGIEEAKIECARRHFKKISEGKIRYDVVSNYEELLEMVTG